MAGAGFTVCAKPPGIVDVGVARRAVGWAGGRGRRPILGADAGPRQAGKQNGQRENGRNIFAEAHIMLPGFNHLVLPLFTPMQSLSDEEQNRRGDEEAEND